MGQTEFGKRMTAARKKAGYSQENANYATRRWLREAHWVSQQTIFRLEHATEEEADEVLVWALSKVYDVPLADLSTDIADWFEEHFREVKQQSRWIPIPAGHHAA